MKKVPLSACLIVRNEEIQIENCLKSIREYVQEIVVIDTGSTDRTPEIARKYADIFEVFTECNDEQGRIDNFAVARQRSFDLATQKWVTWIDGDDELRGAENFQNIISKYDHIEQDVMILLPYEYSHDAEGNVTCIHYRERIFNNYGKNFYWHSPVHETCMPKNPSNLIIEQLENPLYIHRRSAAKIMEPGRNLRILQKYYEKIGDTDARQLYYLGLEYSNCKDLDNSLKCLYKYVELSGWEDEKCLAYLKIAENYTNQGKLNEAIVAALQASSVKENWGEPYFSMARSYYFLAMQGGMNEMRNWQKCAHFAKLGLSLPPTTTVLFINPLERFVDIHTYLNMALAKIGDIEGALESVNKGLLKLNHPQFINNRSIFIKHLSRISINKELGKMIEFKCINQNTYDSVMKVLDTVETIPTSIENSPVINKINEAKLNKKDIKNCYLLNGGSEILFEIFDIRYCERPLDIIFFIGDGLEEWTPQSVIKNGIGGSEIAAIEMAKKLALLGNRVRVFNSCGSSGEGIYDGVEYFQTSKFKNLEGDILIVSRVANMLDDTYQINTKIKLLWVHDMIIVNYKHHLGLKADKILSLSNWHKQNLIEQHNLHNNHVIVTRNGINLERFNKQIKRNIYKCINSSSPDRSWAVLLDIWPEIKKRVPQAELHLLYGFDNWEKLAPYRVGEADTIKRMKDKIESLKSQDVFYKGRLSQEELANEMLSAGAWIFPSWFSETSCIGAMEAQAAGLRIITTAQAALNETVADRGSLIEGIWTSKEYQDKFINETVKALQKEDECDRLLLQEYAKNNFSWDELSKEWNDMFLKLLENLKTNPIIPYMPTKGYQL